MNIHKNPVGEGLAPPVFGGYLFDQQDFVSTGETHMKKILAVDGNSILNRAFYGIRPLTTKEGLHTNAVYGFVNILNRALEEIKPDGFAVAFDMRAPTFRHKEYGGYKATRKGMPEELAMQLPYAKKCAEAMGARVITLEGYEADDILGTVGAMATDSGEVAYILTGDRDSLQLISENVTVLLATNSETVHFDKQKFIETYGITSDKFVDVKALMGDSSDNIPGVPGIGEKTAFKLISEFGTLEGVYDNLDAPDIKPGQRQKLADGKDSAYMSRWLATIVRDAPIGMSVSDIDGRCDRAEAARGELLELFTKLEFSALIKRFGLDAADIPACGCTAESSDKQAVLCATPAEAARRALENRSERIGVMCGDALSFSADGVNVYKSDMREGLSDVLCELHKRGIKLFVYDSKALYSEYGFFDTVTFDFDVTLAAYVADPTAGKYDAASLKLAYLGDSSDGFDGADLLKLSDMLSSLISERSQESLLYEIEMPLAAVLARMEAHGFKIDTVGLEKFTEQLTDAASVLEGRIYFAAGGEFNIKSPIQLSEVLFERLALPHGKKNKNGSYSTSADILEKLAPYHQIVQDILDYRQLTKLKSTYGEGLAKAADERGRIHSSFNQTVTATGRLSSTEPNLQNIPVRTELGRELRRFFIPTDEGRVLIDADYSQIELRLLAHISGDETMTDAFVNGIDIHTVTASQAFGVPLGAVTGEMRKRAKAVNFGIVYGISDFSLAQDIGVTKKQAAEYIEAYLAKYPKVAAYLTDVVEKAKADGYVTTMFGRRRDIPELKSGKKMLVGFGERVAMNSPIQGSAADIIKIAMIKVDKALRESGLDARLILQVHDELIVEASAADAEAARDILVREMENCAPLTVPLTVSAAIGGTWYDCKD